jgi:hypothetical protein
MRMKRAVQWAMRATLCDAVHVVWESLSLQDNATLCNTVHIVWESLLLQDNAEQAVRGMLQAFSRDAGLSEVATVTAEDIMDDGTPICLAITVDRRDGSAVFDFAGVSAVALVTTFTVSSFSLLVDLIGTVPMA